MIFYIYYILKNVLPSRVRLLTDPPPSPPFSLALQDVRGKIIGGRNPYSVVQAIFNCFHDYRTLEDKALALGRRVYDVRRVAPRYKQDL